MISLNIGGVDGVDPVFGGDCVSEFEIGCVQVDDKMIPVTTKCVVIADARD